MFEHYRQPLLPRSAFVKRMLRCISLAFLLLTLTILTGTLVFHQVEHFSVLDAFLNSVLIMTGLGLVGILNSPAGKMFTAFYALLSTFIFYIILAILFSPLLHRLLHRLHLDIDSQRYDPKDK